MIKANELRKGVLIIDYTGIVREVFGEDIQQQCWYEEGQSGTTEAPLNPIALTPDWLVKLGFIGLNHLGKKEYSLIIDSEFTIEVCFYAELVVRLITRNENHDENIQLGEFITYREVKNCAHVHKIQNLYFALAGKEIEMKQ